jgi:hypothetical protein
VRPKGTIPPPETSANGRPTATWSSSTNSNAPFFNGIVRIGELDGDIGALERQSEDFSVTIRREDECKNGGLAQLRRHVQEPGAVRGIGALRWLRPNPQPDPERNGTYSQPRSDFRSGGMPLPPIEAPASTGSDSQL